MSVYRKITKNVIALILSNVLFACALFIFNIFSARYLGAVEFGKFSLAIAFTGLFAVLSHLGLWVTLTRDVVLNKSQVERYFFNIFVLQIVLSLFMFLVILLIVNFIQYDHETKIVIYIISIAAIAMSFVMLSRSIFRAFEEMAWDLIPTVIGSGTLLICGLLALHAGVQLINIALIYSAAHVLMFIAGLVIVIKRFTKLNIKIEFIFWKSLLLTSIPFAINGFLVPIYHRIDIVMISFLKDEAAVGLYNAANVLAVSPFIILGYGFSHALFPSFTYYFTNDRQIFNSIVEKAFKYSTSLLIPIGAGVTLLASQFVQIIYGPQFIQSVDAMKLLIWTGIILFLNILYINIMEATGKQKYATAILGTGAVSNVILNYILIPPFGINGAAVATIVTQAICLIFAHYVTRRDLSYKIIVGVAIRPIIASALMSIFIIYFPEINIILTIFLAIIIYFIVLYLLRGINKSDITFFKELKQ